MVMGRARQIRITGQKQQQSVHHQGGEVEEDGEGKRTRATKTTNRRGNMVCRPVPGNLCTLYGPPVYLQNEPGYTC
eukprot:15328038-Ditylum_brightwellii.AAC.3